MQKIHFSIVINAPRERVWDTMLEDKTYREWTNDFNSGSYFEGSWAQDSKIKFLDPDKSGLVSTIAENKPHEFISIKHLGVISDGVEDTTSDEAKNWTGYENYTFKELETNQTELIVDMDANDEFKDYFEKTWPKALQKLKELSEN